jgi:cysteine desulfurase/selenocysteine lyase
MIPRPGGLDTARVRDDFPAVARSIDGRSLVHLDNASTTHKPRCVLDALVRHYEDDNANVRRAVHSLGVRATSAYERARGVVRDFLGAADEREIVFTSGTTASINLVAASWGRSHLGPGDEVLVTEMEHHANIVPWQLVCRQTGASLRVAPIDDRGEVIVDAFAALLGPRTKLVGIVHVSNALGTVNPVSTLARLARRHGAVVLVDGAQAVAHLDVDVRELECDFYAFSGHKLYGPTGVGVLYGRGALLDAMPPWQGGGEMVRSVTWDGATYDEPPHRFEAGTPPIAGAVGLAAAIEYLAGLDVERRRAHGRDLMRYAEDALRSIRGLRIIGTAREKVGGHSFVLDGIHAHDVATILDQEGVAVRAGHHCAEPTMRRFGVPATTRASFAVYNTRDDVDRLIAGLERVCRTLR